jgi:phage anti-repressor protein
MGAEAGVVEVMDPDTEDAAWAQLECEARQYHQLLANDPGYEKWIELINEINQREKTCEIPCES